MNLFLCIQRIVLYMLTVILTLRHICLPRIKQWKQPSQLVNESLRINSVPAEFRSANKEALKNMPIIKSEIS